MRGVNAEPSKKRITDAEYGRFRALCQWLDVPRPADTARLASWPQGLHVSGLLTNGRGPAEDVEVFYTDSISIVEHYATPKTPTKPSRDEHLAWAKRPAKIITRKRATT